MHFLTTQIIILSVYFFKIVKVVFVIISIILIRVTVVRLKIESLGKIGWIIILGLVATSFIFYNLGYMLY